MVRIKHFISKACCLIGGKLYGNYLISSYMLIKLYVRRQRRGAALSA
jgi:hypothetical protein